VPLSVAEWLQSQRTERDIRAEQIALKRQLLSSFRAIWQSYASRAREQTDSDQLAWWEAYEAEMRPREGEDNTARWLRFKKWRKKNKPTGLNAEAAKWEKQWIRLNYCQSEWIGFRAACCEGFTQPAAVPIGCNLRMCPLCAWQRSQRARKRVKTLFDRLTHPVLSTLTIPNSETIQKKNIGHFRKQVRQFIAQHKSWIKGGVYAIETTYNRKQKTWHVHAHILVDVASPLPAKTERVLLAGRRVFAFTALKLRLEFDWMRLWSRTWGRLPRADAKARALNRDTFKFESWVREGRVMSLKVWRPGGWQPIAGLSREEMERRTAWNAANRRVLDLRPVMDREGAAREVLKYITKSADFCDIPEAVEAFCNAVRGARMVQTFGSWYGVNLDEEPDAEHSENWGEFQCSCGANMWERTGVFYPDDVERDESGRWHLKWPLDHRCRGTVPRPTIRALDARHQ
jgi:hypothetical protein